MKALTSSLFAGSKEAPRRILIIHGYTGSPDEFRPLAEELARRLDASVEVPLLPGHGTSEEDLVRFSLEDLVAFVRERVREIAEGRKPFALIGHSFGGHLALLAAAEFPPQAAVVTVLPFVLRAPFSIPGMDLYARTKTFWDKEFKQGELEERKQHFFYKRMPGVALGYTKELNRRLALALPRLKFPLCTINNRADPLSLPESAQKLLEESGKNPHNKILMLDKDEHGVFYGKGSEAVVRAISDFLAKVML